MNKSRIFDIAFMLLSFGIYMIVLNLDQNIDEYNVVFRHFWLPLIVAYFVGRFVSVYSSIEKS